MTLNTGKRARGFTVLELLIVIAIIGFLTAIILPSLTAARSKAKDAAIKENLSLIPPAAESYYNDQSQGKGSYGLAGSDNLTGGVCGDANVVKILAGAQQQMATAPVCVQNAGLFSAATAYKVAAQLNDGTYFCVDSTGNKGATTTDEVTPTTVYTCQ